MNKLTVEKKEKLKAALPKVLAFIVQQTKTEEDNTIGEEILESVKQVDFETPVTSDGLAEACFDVAEVVTSLTDTKVDDAVVNTGRGIYEATEGKGGGLFAAIKGWFAIHHAKKAEAKTDAQGE